MSALPILDDDELQKIYVWVDSIPLSRPKRNISRDFSDGGAWRKHIAAGRVQLQPARIAGARRHRQGTPALAADALGCCIRARRAPPARPRVVWIRSLEVARLPHIAPFIRLAVLVAEVVHHYFPKLVELHNYSAANSLRQKLYNWGTLNTKVFRRLGGFEVKRGDVEAIVNCKPGVIEAVLMQLQQKVRGGGRLRWWLWVGGARRSPGHGRAVALQH